MACTYCDDSLRAKAEAAEARAEKAERDLAEARRELALERAGAVEVGSLLAERDAALAKLAELKQDALFHDATAASTARMRGYIAEATGVKPDDQIGFEGTVLALCADLKDARAKLARHEEDWLEHWNAKCHENIELNARLASAERVVEAARELHGAAWAVDFTVDPDRYTKLGAAREATEAALRAHDSSTVLPEGVAASAMDGHEAPAQNRVVGQFEIPAPFERQSEPQGATVGSGRSATSSDSSQTWSERPAAIAGVTRRV